VSRPSERVHHMRTIVTRRKTQTRSCGSNLRMRPERDDTETRGLRAPLQGGSMPRRNLKEQARKCSAVRALNKAKRNANTSMALEAKAPGGATVLKSQQPSRR
jgi:hypothetical protein